MDRYGPGFESDDALRSDFIRILMLRQASGQPAPLTRGRTENRAIPRTLVRFWHDPLDVPADVRECLASWEVLRSDGFQFMMFGDESAAAFIAAHFGHREQTAFARCTHPAMRSDYLRLCVVLAQGGLYVDADDVLLNTDWEAVFRNNALKLQPLCYDISTAQMVSANELRQADMNTGNRIFYVNNNPMAAPAGHPVLRDALSRATEKLLKTGPAPEIQSTTGPGNLTAALAAHARNAEITGAPTDFELLFDWEATAKPRWDLTYRNDERNWRNIGQN